MEGKVPPSMDWWVQASWPHSTSWHQCWGAIMAEQQKVIFLLDSGTRFSVLPFSLVPGPMTKVIIRGQIWPACRALVYLASGLLLGRPPLLSLFPHSTWNSSVPVGTGFTISIKSSNSPPPRQLSLLPPPSATKRFHSVDWWDECRVSQDGPPYSNKTQKIPHSFHI
jgi:hypothetical protein